MKNFKIQRPFFLPINQTRNRSSQLWKLLLVIIVHFCHLCASDTLNAQTENTEEKYYVGFEIDHQTYFKIDNVNAIKPLDWYYLIEEKGHQMIEWSIDNNDKLTMSYENIITDGFKGSAEAKKISKSIFTRDTFKSFYASGDLCSIRQPYPTEINQIDSLTEELLTNGVGYNWPPVIETIQSLQEEGFSVSIQPNNEILAVNDTTTISYSPESGQYTMITYNSLGERSGTYFTHYERNAAGYDLPILEVENIPTRLPSGACVEKITQRLYNNYSILEPNQAMPRVDNKNMASDKLMQRFFIYPNPSSTGMVHLAINSSDSSRINVVVSDLNGKSYIRQEYDYNVTGLYPLTISFLAKGTYTVTIKTPNAVKTELLTIQ
jgi:hypothetical protein